MSVNTTSSSTDPISLKLYSKPTGVILSLPKFRSESPAREPDVPEAIL